MKKDIKNLFRNKVLHIILLSALWLFSTLLYVIVFDTSFSIWSYNHPNSDIKNLNYDPIFKDETFKGEIKGQDNNLGIIALRFQTYIRPPYQQEDKYLFKIKEKDAKDWYYINTYRSGLVYDVPFFPFGFPQIRDSKGKTYHFEITALNTNSVNQLSLSKRYPLLESKYKYSGKELLKNQKEMLNFLMLKFSNAFKTPDVVFSSFIYLLPLAFYLLIINSKKNKYIKYSYLFLFIIVFTDVIFFQLSNDTIYFVLPILWLGLLRNLKKESKISFVSGLILVALCPLFLLFKMEPIAEKSAAWAYMFFLAGTIQIFIEQNESK